METWTSIKKFNYMVLTMHFIDDDWKLQKRILNFFLIPDHEEYASSHEEDTIDDEEDTIEGDNVGKMIETCLLDWGIEKVFTVTVDNASYNDRALAYLVEKIRNQNGVVLNGDFVHVKSFARIVNLMARDALKEFHGSIAKIRNAIEYVKSSSFSLLKIFKNWARDENISCKNPLYLDVPTRWNSTYTMLERAVKFQKACERVEAEDEKFCRLECVHHDIKMDPPRSEDWDNAHAFLKLLKLFHDVILRVSRSPSCVTSHRYFHEICLIRKKIEEFSRSDNSLLANTAKNMKVKYETFWENSEKTNFLSYVSIVLDPRYKLRFVLFTLSLLYGEERSNEIVKKIEDTTRSLYNEYQTSNVESETAYTSMDQPLVEDVGEEGDEDYASMFSRCLIEQHAWYKKSELDKYLSEPCETGDETFDILDWWKLKSSKYKVLGKMAKDVLAIPHSTTAPESAFRTGDRVLDSYHSRLSPKLVEVVVCLRNWLCSQDNKTDVALGLEELDEDEDEEEF